MEKLAGPLVVDLLWHLPSGLIDRRHQPHLSAAEHGAIATLVVRVERHMKPHNPRAPYKVRCSDPTGFVDLVFFNVRGDYLEKVLPVGAMRAISGRLERYDGALNMVHPDHMVPAEELAQIQIVEPVYPMTAGLAPKVLRKAIDAALAGRRNSPNGSIPPCWRSAAGSAGTRRCWRRIALEKMPICRRWRHPASASPMTNC